MARRRRHSPEQIVRKLSEGERMLNDGKNLTEVLRLLEVTDSTWHRWRAQYRGMKANDAKRLKELEVENGRLKKLLAEAERDKAMLKELAERRTSDPGSSPPCRGAAARSVRGLRTQSLSGRGSASLVSTPATPPRRCRRGEAQAPVAARWKMVTPPVASRGDGDQRQAHQTFVA
jgi:putative transposase